MATVIIGGGIMGVSTAFYLTQAPSTTKPSDVHIVEVSLELFASASGFAAGFLAEDWFGPELAPLGKLSFDLHKSLAAEHGGAEKWGYCRCTGTSYSEGPPTGKRGDDWLRSGGSRRELVATHEFRNGRGPAWLTQSNDGRLEIISEDSSTAQVDPLRLSRFLLQTCRDRGVQLHQPAKVLSVQHGLNGKVVAVVIKDLNTGSSQTIHCERLVLTTGAWTGRVFQELFPSSPIKLPIGSLAGHSLVVRSPRWKAGDEAAADGGGCHSVFTTESAYSPEIFSRLGGEIYIAGVNDWSLPVPETAMDRKIQPEKIELLRNTARRLLGQEGLDDLEVLRQGLCFRPVTDRGTPFIGRIPQAVNVFLSAGHGPWGISHSLGTGKVMAEMLEGRETSCDVAALALSSGREYARL